MAVNWDDFTPVDNKTPVSPAYRPADVNWDAFTPVNKQNTGIGGDTLTGLKIGLERLPGMVTGLADVPIAAITGRRYADEAGDYLGKATGFQPAKWSNEAEEEYSPKYKASQAAVDQVWKDPNTNGWDVAGAYLTNPRMIGGMVAENAPQLLVGGVAGRGVLAAANKLAPLARVAPLVGEDLLLANKARDAAMTTRDIVAGGAGEGIITAGQNMDSTDRSADPRKAALASAAGGAITGAIGAGSGKLANELGLGDVQNAMMGVQAGGKAMPAWKRIGGGALQEGLIEEAPQSANEAGWQNWAEGKPVTEGMARQAIEGGLVGGIMGAGMNAFHSSPAPTVDPGADPNAPPIVPPVPPVVPPTGGTPPAPPAPVGPLTRAAQQAGTPPTPSTPAPPATPNNLVSPVVDTVPPLPTGPTPEEQQQIQALQQRIQRMESLAVQFDAAGNPGDAATLREQSRQLTAQSAQIQAEAQIRDAKAQSAGQEDRQSFVEDTRELSDLVQAERSDQQQRITAQAIQQRVAAGAQLDAQNNLIVPSTGESLRLSAVQAGHARALIQRQQKQKAQQDYDAAIASLEQSRATQLDGPPMFVMPDGSTLTASDYNALMATGKMPEHREVEDAAQKEMAAIAKEWDQTNRSSRNSEWQAGSAEANPSFNSVDASHISAHGMAKAGTLSGAIKSLVSMVRGGIDGARTLHYDALTSSNANASGGATAGGHAYRDGPFIITFREGLNGRQPTSKDITGVLVNPSHSSLVAPLQAIFPNLAIRDYNGVKDVVAASEAKKAPTVQAESAPAPEQAAHGLPAEPVSVKDSLTAQSAAEQAPPPASESKPLYASRPVANAADILAWAKSQGFTSTLPADDLHVTVAYSTAPVDGSTIKPADGSVTAKDGKRSVERLGDEGAVVLKFASMPLQIRWNQYRKAGASWDYEKYQPHITLTYQGGDMDLSKVEPYRGPIVLGAETQEDLNEDKAEEYKEVPASPQIEAYEDRYKARVAQIQTASTNEAAQAIVAEEHKDAERHFEGTSAVERAAKERKYYLGQEESERQKQNEIDAGEWVDVDGTWGGSRSGAEQRIPELQKANPDYEYRVSSYHDDYIVRTRKKRSDNDNAADISPAPTTEPVPDVPETNFGNMAQVPESKGAEQAPEAPPQDESALAAAAIAAHGLPEGTAFQSGKGSLGSGRVQAILGDTRTNLFKTHDEAAADLSRQLATKEQNAREAKQQQEAQSVLAEKLKKGEQPTMAQWGAGFPNIIRASHTSVEQSAIAPFLTEYFGFPDNNIRANLGDAVGDFVSDTGSKSPIVYFGKLAAVLKEQGEQDAAPLSDQDKSWQDYAQNFADVAGTPDLKQVSTVNLRRAWNFADTQKSSEQRKGWDGGAVDQAKVREYETQAYAIRAELVRRGDIKPQEPAANTPIDAGNGLTINPIQDENGQKFSVQLPAVGAEQMKKAGVRALAYGGFHSKALGSGEFLFSTTENAKSFTYDNEIKQLLYNHAERVSGFTPLMEITVTVKATVAETGETASMDERADVAIKDVDERLTFARNLLKCLAS